MRRVFLLLILSCLMNQMLSASTFTVTNTNDAGDGSLRWAVESANGESEVSVVRFELPVSSVIVLDSTIDVKSSVRIDGALTEGRVTITASQYMTMFSLPNTKMDVFSFENIKIRFGDTERFSNKVIVNFDSTETNFVVKNSVFENSYDFACVCGNRIKIDMQESTCDSISNRIFSSKKMSDSWRELNIKDCVFTDNGTVVIGGTSGYTSKMKILNSQFYNNKFVLNGDADSMVIKNCMVKNNVNSVFQFGGVDCHSVAEIDSCQVYGAGSYSVYVKLTGFDLSITNSEFYGATVQDVYLYRQKGTKQHSKLCLKNNKFGIKGQPFKGVITDADYTLIQNNDFLGATKDGIAKGFGLYDRGSDTLVAENNRFGSSGIDEVPNEAGAVYLRPNFYDFGIETTVDPLIVIRDNLFDGNGGNAIQMDSVRIHPVISRNIFLATDSLAISNFRRLAIPTIDGIEISGSDLKVKGHVDSVATVELFYTTGTNQTAEEFLGSVTTDDNGNFNYSFPRTKMAGREKVCISATATYGGIQTSNLSDPVCCESCLLDLSRKNYYVKTTATGDGSGRNWENAMNGEDFALYLPLVPDGVTFHVAEGRYMPVYDVNLNKPIKKSDLCYVINSDVSIIGGYPADALTGAVSVPDTYKTVFDGDILGDDEVEESKDENGRLKMTVTGTDDNASNVFYAKEKAVNIRLDGINVLNAGSYGVLGVVYNQHVEVDNSSFENCSSAITLLYEDAVLNVTHTDFGKNRSYAIQVPNVKTTTIVGCDFEKNVGNLVFAASEGVVMLDSVNAVNNNANVKCINNTELHISNSNFEKNDCSEGIVYLYNSDKKENAISKSKFGQNQSQVIANNAPYMSIDSCLFEENEDWCIYGEGTQTTEVAYSLFEKNKKMIYIQGTGPTEIYSCTFMENGKNVAVDERRPLIYSYSLSVRNSTLANNETYQIIYASVLNLTNNTIVGNDVLGLVPIQGIAQSQNLYGNIILGNRSEGENRGYAMLSELYSIKEITNNLMNVIRTNPQTENYDMSTWIPDNETNIYIRPFNLNDGICNACAYTEKETEEYYLTSLFEGTYDSEKHLFTPVLSYNGGFTPTVALKTDRLPDGTFIRFPLTETTVTEDQRGASRLEQTCMGAYELKCTPVYATVSDTILLAESYTFGDTIFSSSKPCRIEYKDTLRTWQGCDSIVSLNLVVRPEHSRNGYYVKVDGTGDGSDWVNAMSPEDFAAYLPFVYDGDTFHVAAGRYVPLQKVREIGKGYEFNASVTLVGGYPDTVTVVGTPSSPDLYETLLTADLGENDYFSMYGHLESVVVDKTEDNAPLLLYTDGKHNLSLYGLTLSGAANCDYGAVNLNRSSLNMQRCVMKNNVASAIKGKLGNVSIDNCYFYENVATNGAVFQLDSALLNVNSSSFELNVTSASCGRDYESTHGGVADLSDGEASFVNSSFVSNRSFRGSVFHLRSSEAQGKVSLSLVNNTFTGNGNVETDNGDGMVVFSSAYRADVEMFGNIMVGNGGSPFAVAEGSVMNTKTDYNICDVRNSWIAGSKDMLMDPTEMKNVLDGDYVYSHPDYFMGKLRLNEGYTPTVAVVASAFAGGEVLSIPREMRRVDVDQRGFLRKDTSCVGAYEFPTFVDYYVKQKASGDGTGRTWENAMSDTTFAQYFPIVPNGATFHIAEGRYTPMVDNYGRLTDSRFRAYNTVRLVNLDGGYPSDARTGALSDPFVNHTLLTADYKGDDVSVEAAYPGSVGAAYGNRRDNGYYVMNISPKIAGWNNIYGVEFEGSSCVSRGSSAALTLSSSNVEGVYYKLDHCSFAHNYVGVYSSTDSLLVSECRFDSMEYTALSHSSRSLADSHYVMVDKSTFRSNANGLYLLSEGSGVIQNSTFLANNTSISLYGPFASKQRKISYFLYNNTLSEGEFGYGDVYISQMASVTMHGNILNVNEMRRYMENSDAPNAAFVSDYNVYIVNPQTLVDDWHMGEHDVLLPASALGGVLDGSYDEEKQYFVSTLSDNGGFGKNIALLNVALPGDKSVKMIPEGTTPVTDDQRFVPRDKVYCAGAYEVDCSFADAKFGLQLADDVVCRDDTAQVELVGLSTLEANTYKYKWSTEVDSVRILDDAANPARFHIYSRRAEVPMKLTVTNTCGVDTVLTIIERVSGTGNVPFGGLEDAGVVCKNSTSLVELTTEVAGATFEGECVVDGHYFDASLAKGDSTRVRCWVKDGDCRSFDDKTVYFYKSVVDEGFSMQVDKQTMNKCMTRPDAMVRISVAGWKSDWEYRLDGVEKEAKSWTLSDDSVATIEYDSLAGASYDFIVSDRCSDIDTLTLQVQSVNPYTISIVDSLLSVRCARGTEAFFEFRVEGGAGDLFDLRLNDEDMGRHSKGETLRFDHRKKGDYQILITSPTEGCQDMSMIPLKVEGPDTMAATLEVLGLGCEAVIVAHVSGEEAPYKYQWFDYADYITDQTGDSLKNVGVGSYVCLINPANGCGQLIRTAEVEPETSLTGLSVSYTSTDETCMDGNNGTVTVNLSTPNPNQAVTVVLTSANYSFGVREYKRSGTAAMGPLLFDGLEPLDYQLTAYYGTEDCIAALSDVNEPLSIHAKTQSLSVENIKFDAVTCLNPINGAIHFRVDGWDSGYGVTLNGNPLSPSNVSDESALFDVVALPGGSYCVFAEDNCRLHSDSVTVVLPSVQPYDMKILSYSKSLDCAKSTDGYVEILVSGGIPDNSVLWVKGLESKKFAELPAKVKYESLSQGLYSFHYDSQVEGCFDYKIIDATIEGPDTLKANYIVGCEPDSTVINVIAKGESNEFEYLWKIPGVGELMTELPELEISNAEVNYDAEYICDVIAKNGCDTLSLPIKLLNASELSVPKINKKVDGQYCIGVDNASVQAWADKQSGYRATFALTDLSSGKLIGKRMVDGSEKIKFEGLAPSSYQIKLYYGGIDCELGGPVALDTVEIETLLPLSEDGRIIKDLTCLSEPNGFAQINIASGWSSHHLAALLHIDDDDGFIAEGGINPLYASSSSGQSAQYAFSNMKAGKYRIRISDVCVGARSYFDFEVKGIEPYRIELLDKTDFLPCYTDDTAHISIEIKGGAAKNQYYMDGESPVTLMHDSVINLTHLTAGDYKFHYYSTVNGCSDGIDKTVHIATDSVRIKLRKEGKDCVNAFLLAEVGGGSAPYSFAWGNENANPMKQESSAPYVLTNVGAGRFFATVTDNIGCSALSDTVSAVLVNVASGELGLKLDSVAINSLNCFGSETGDVKVFYSGNAYASNIGVALSRSGALVKEVVSASANDTILFSGLEFDQYDVRVFYQGAEDCTAGIDNLQRHVDVVKPDTFKVSFSATKTLCEKSHDAQIRTNTHAGVPSYLYEWHMLTVGEDELTVQESMGSDTLKGLPEGVSCWCRVTDRNGCEIKSDTFKIEYSGADTTKIENFQYDPYQRCKGHDNARVEVSFSSVSEMVAPYFTLEKLGSEAKLLDVVDADSSDSKILVDNVAPGKYRFFVGYPADGCPSLLDSTLEIKSLVNDFAFASNLDSTKGMTCFSDPNGFMNFHLEGASKGLEVTVAMGDSMVATLKADSVVGDCSYYSVDSLSKGDYTVTSGNVCGESAKTVYRMGGIDTYEVAVDTKLSKLRLKCPYSTDGVVAFSLKGGEPGATYRFEHYVDRKALFCDSVSVDTVIDIVRVDSVYRMDTIIDHVALDTIYKVDNTIDYIKSDTVYKTVFVTDSVGNLIKDRVEMHTFKDTTVAYYHCYQTIVSELKAVDATPTQVSESTYSYKDLLPETYYVTCRTSLEGCRDSVVKKVTVSRPLNVNFLVDTMQISCSSYSDGVMSVLPVRGVKPKYPKYMLKRDSSFVKVTDGYDVCYLCGLKKEQTTILGEQVTTYHYEPVSYDDKPVMTRINLINNENKLWLKTGDGELESMDESVADLIYGEEFVSMDWSILQNGEWMELPDYRKEVAGKTQLGIVLPDSSDVTEEAYYLNGDSLIVPVWSCSHLEKFWFDAMGNYQDVGVQTLSNLPATWYAVQLADSAGCVYNDTIEIRKPADALVIDSVRYLGLGDDCNPEKRQMVAYAKGGWGEYLYTFVDTVKMENGGAFDDGYLAGAAAKYDPSTKTGWGRSEFLTPGSYLVTVMDEKGCIVKAASREDVKTRVVLSADTASARCHGEVSSELKVHVGNDARSYHGLYVVKEHYSPCRDDVTACVDDSFGVILDGVKADANNDLTLNLSVGNHGIFVYEMNDDGSLGCGGYVKVMVVDTVKTIGMTRKFSTNVSCKGADDGEIELFITGGKSPYTLRRTNRWGDTTAVGSVKSWTIKASDLTDWKSEEPDALPLHVYSVEHLEPGDYYFTLVDDLGCHKVLGDTFALDTVVTIKEPERLVLTAASSSLCRGKGASNDLNVGSVSAKNVTGGTPPYLYSLTGGVSYSSEGVGYAGAVFDSESGFIPIVGDTGTVFKYEVKDANGCMRDTSLRFNRDVISVSRYDFLASSWSHNGDILALIDFCGPESAFDSVSYKFMNASGEVDSRVEELDKRMYIFDIAAGKPADRAVLEHLEDTRVVPDKFFTDKFNLIDGISESLANHITLVKLNDNTGSSSQKTADKVWSEFDVQMSSFFKGCRYETEVYGLKIAYDDVVLYDGGVDRRKDILAVNIYDDADGFSNISIVLSGDMDCDLYLYHMNGVTSWHEKTLAGSYIAQSGSLYDASGKTVYNKVVKFKDSMFDTENKESEVIVVYVKTKHDSYGTYMITK